MNYIEFKFVSKTTHFGKNLQFGKNSIVPINNLNLNKVIDGFCSLKHEALPVIKKVRASKYKIYFDRSSRSLNMLPHLGFLDNSSKTVSLEYAQQGTLSQAKISMCIQRPKYAQSYFL